MLMNRRLKMLLIAVVALVAIKYMLMPLFEWQLATVESIQLAKNKLLRISLMEENDARLRKDYDSVSKLSAEIENFIPSIASGQNVQLSVQEKLGSLVRSQGAQVVLLDWASDSSIDSRLNFARANIQLRGAVSSLAALHGQIEPTLPFCVVREFTVNATAMSIVADSSHFVVGFLMLDCFYRKAQ